MISGFGFDKLLARHNHAIGVGRATDIKKGNRCAMVLGTALHLYPRKHRGETTMRDLATSTEYKIKNWAKIGLAVLAGGKYDESVGAYDQPFMDRLFVKAKDLANGIRERYGPPEFSGSGKEFLKWKGRNQKGVMYLGGFWHGGTGDHIDLWNGVTLNVTGNAQDSLGEITASRVIWFWVVR